MLRQHLVAMPRHLLLCTARNSISNMKFDKDLLFRCVKALRRSIVINPTLVKETHSIFLGHLKSVFWNDKHSLYPWEPNHFLYFVTSLFWSFYFNIATSIDQTYFLSLVMMHSYSNPKVCYPAVPGKYTIASLLSFTPWYLSELLYDGLDK